MGGVGSVLLKQMHVVTIFLVATACVAKLSSEDGGIGVFKLIRHVWKRAMLVEAPADRRCLVAVGRAASGILATATCVARQLSGSRSPRSRISAPQSTQAISQMTVRPALSEECLRTPAWQHLALGVGSVLLKQMHVVTIFLVATACVAKLSSEDGGIGVFKLTRHVWKRATATCVARQLSGSRSPWS